MRFGSELVQLRVVIATLLLAYGMIQIVLALRHHGLTMNFDLKHGIIFASFGVVVFLLHLTRKKSPEGIEL
jgi:hypothetical protein